MELSSFIRCLESFKNEFYYILPKSTNVEISISKTNRVFMILSHSSKNLIAFGNIFSLVQLSNPLMKSLLMSCTIHPLQLSLSALQLP